MDDGLVEEESFAEVPRAGEGQREREILPLPLTEIVTGFELLATRKQRIDDPARGLDLLTAGRRIGFPEDRTRAIGCRDARG